MQCRATDYEASRADRSQELVDHMQFADQMMSDEKKLEDANEVDNGGCPEEGPQPSILNKDVLGMNFYGDHQFGTEEAPAVVQSLYNRIIVGCPGGTREGHDMVWFWLEKDKPHECAVCSQFFKLEVVDIGGQPDGGRCEFNNHQ